MRSQFIKQKNPYLSSVTMKVLWLIFATSLISCHCNEYMHFVKDFVNFQYAPTRINAYVCWSKDEMVKFHKLLSSNEIHALVTSNFDQFFYSTPEEQLLIILDLSCPNAKNWLTKVVQQKFFHFYFRWLIWNFQSLEDFTNLYFGVSSRIYLLEKDGTEYNISTIYKFGENSSFVKDQLGKWSKFGGLHNFYEYTIHKNRSNLEGLNLGVSYVYLNPDTLNHLTDYRDPHIDTITKNNFIILRHIVDIMNGSIVPMWRTNWGYLNKTTNLFDGLIGDLQTGRAELGGTSCFFTPDRIAIIEYTSSTANTFMKFLFRKPPLTYVANVFTLPFGTSVWYACFILIGIGMLITYVIVYWEWKDPIFNKKLNHMDFISPLLPDVSDICITQVGLITQQGSESEPKSSSGRIATIFLMISLMFLYCAYSANIVALLQSRTDSINSVQDLLTSRIKLGVEDIVYIYYYFKMETDPQKLTLYDQKVAPKGQKGNFMTIQEGIARMRNEFFAFHVELSRAYKVIGDTFQEHEKCALTTVTYFNNIVAPYLQIRKNSTYKELVKVGMRQIQESGIQNREFLKLYTKKPHCQSEGSSFESVGLIDCYAAFLIIGIGIVLSITFNLLEILIFRYQERRNLGTIQNLADKDSEEDIITVDFID